MRGTAFYIAKRYLISKKGSTAVTFITWLAAVAMMVAVAAMFIIVSVFSGLEDLNRDMIANVHSDITIKSNSGKSLADIKKVESALEQNQNVKYFSKTIEEKVYLNYGENGTIAVLRGVDTAYTKVNPIYKDIFYGAYPSFVYSNEVIMENQLDSRLSIPVGDSLDYATVMMPKPGTGIISNEEDIFNKKNIFVTGVFNGKGQLDNTIISPIELTEQLLNLPKNSAYEIVVKLKDPNLASEVKSSLEKKLGKDYEIKTKDEQNAAFWKMINTEKMFIYLIFALVIFITTFNLAGAVIILQLDKKEQAKSLLSMGLPLYSLRSIYFYTGLLIVVFGIVSGLIIGTLLCLFQINTSFFAASATLPFPVNINLQNYLIVAATTAGFGLLISWFFSKVNKNTLEK